MSLAPSLKWESLNLSEPVLKTIKEHFKFKCMTPIQVIVCNIKKIMYLHWINKKLFFVGRIYKEFFRKKKRCRCRSSHWQRENTGIFSANARIDFSKFSLLCL